MKGKKKTRKCAKNPFQIDLGKITAKIDNKAPRFNPDDYMKSRLILQDTARMKVLDRENLELLQRLNILNRSCGKFDCSSLPTGKSYESKFSATKAKNRAIERDNKKLLKEILATRSEYSTAEMLRDWKRIEDIIEHLAKYPLISKTPSGSKNENLMIADHSIGKKIPNSRCFFDIELSQSKESLGRIVFELYDRFAPASCANFLTFCEGNEEGLSYKGTPFHRIVPKYWCQGGDVTKFNGTGGASLKQVDKSKDENFILRHSGPGVISAWKSNDSISTATVDKYNSRFNITFDSLPTMDGKRVVFGKIIHGLSNLYKIEEMGCSTGKPIKKVIISNCGVLRRTNSMQNNM